MTHRRRCSRERQQLQIKAQANGIVLGITLIFAEMARRNSQPGDMWPSVLNDAAQKQAQEFCASFLALAVHNVLC
jgi:hypothetical protein